MKRKFETCAAIGCQDLNKFYQIEIVNLFTYKAENNAVGEFLIMKGVVKCLKL